MPFRDMTLAAFVAVVWGLAFVATRIALDSFTPAQLTALRFLIACVPVLILPRPNLPWRTLVPIGLTLFAGQFLLLFFAFTRGMPPGVASVTQQMQVFFTVLLAAIVLREIPTTRQIMGMVTACAGLAAIALSVDADLTWLGLGLALASAASWAIGNILVKRHPGAPMLALMVWLSLIPPLPALAVAAAFDRGPSLPTAIAAATWAGWIAALYLGAVATVLAYAIWGRLLTRYSAATVAPFALIAPCVGVAGSAVAFGEAFPPLRYVGMALIVAGVAVTVWPVIGRRKGYQPLAR
ncbi:MAG: EamA family transporter [Rhodospirillales bacterium]|nr:EamA family transporter [Rhodospirillales bacterium]